MNNTIQFKDTEARLSSFHYMETYSGWLEGHPMYASWRILKELWNQLQKEEDLVFVHQGEVVSPEKLNDIEHFESDRAISQYVRELRDSNPEKEKIHPFIELKRAKYVAHFNIGYEYLLTMVWFDDEMDMTKPLKDVLESVTKNIEYKKYCKFFDLDNL